MVFEVPVGPEGHQNRPGVASKGFLETKKVASGAFGRVASRQVDPKCRKPAEISATQPDLSRVESKVGAI